MQHPSPTRNPTAPTRDHHASRLERLRRQQWRLGSAAMVLVFAVWSAGWLERLEQPTIDWRTRLFHRWVGGPSPQVVVMGIDDRAIEAVGRWPWSRAAMAGAVDELTIANAKTIALDVMFDRSADQDPAGDAALAKAISAHGAVVLPLRLVGVEQTVETGRMPDAAGVVDLLNDAKIRDLLSAAPDPSDARIVTGWLAEARGKAQLEAPDVERVADLIRTARTIMSLEGRSSLSVDAAGKWRPPPLTNDAITAIPAIGAGAAALGDVTIVGGGVALGADGVYRRTPLWTRLGERVWPTLSLAAVSLFLERDVAEMRLLDGVVTEIPAETVVRIGAGGLDSAALGKYPFLHTITWPRGGKEWQGQFSDPSFGPQEVSVLVALEPWLAREAVAQNLETLERLIQLAEKLRLGEFPRALELVRELRGTPMHAEEWAPRLEAAGVEGGRVAELARDYLEFAGEVNPAELSVEDRRTHFEHRDVAEKIPALLAECREAPGRIEMARQRLRGTVASKLVFVGWIATGAVADKVNTSLRAHTPGVYVHAAAASSFLTGFARQRAPLWLDAMFIALMGIGGIVTARGVAVWAAPILLAALIGAWFLFAGAVLWDAAWLIASVAGPTLAGATSWLAVLLHRLLVEQRQRRRTEDRFRAYVSPAVVDELVNNPQLDSMTPQRRELTIMFCDVTGFTAMAEKLGAEGTSRFLGGYLGRMTDTLLRHGATIDKYLGDGIMAFWGAPIHEPRHARSGCRAAASLVRAVTEFGEQAATRSAEGPGPLRIRIGLAAGDVMVGDFGNPPIRSSYTVLGDACNIAARLERACKTLGTTIVASASVRAGAGEGFLWRPLGRFVLHGRLAPEPIFELVGMTGATGNPDDASLALMPGPGRARIDLASVGPWIDATQEAVAAFADGKWEEAREKFQTLARVFGDEPLAKVYLDAIARRVAGEGPTDGVALRES